MLVEIIQSKFSRRLNFSAVSKKCIVFGDNAGEEHHLLQGSAQMGPSERSPSLLCLTLLRSTYDALIELRMKAPRKHEFCPVTAPFPGPPRAWNIVVFDKQSLNEYMRLLEQG